MRAELGSSEQGALKVTVKFVLFALARVATAAASWQGLQWAKAPYLGPVKLLRLGPRVVALCFGGRCVLAGVVSFRGPRPSAEHLKRVVHGVVRRFGFFVRLVC